MVFYEYMYSFGYSTSSFITHWGVGSRVKLRAGQPPGGSPMDPPTRGGTAPLTAHHAGEMLVCRMLHDTCLQCNIEESYQ